jgi:hypothetical protein
LEVHVGPDCQREMSVGTHPNGDICGIEMREGALHKLACPIGTLDGFRAHADIDGRVNELSRLAAIYGVFFNLSCHSVTPNVNVCTGTHLKL